MVACRSRLIDAQSWACVRTLLVKEARAGTVPETLEEGPMEIFPVPFHSFLPSYPCATSTSIFHDFLKPPRHICTIRRGKYLLGHLDNPRRRFGHALKLSTVN